MKWCSEKWLKCLVTLCVWSINKFKKRRKSILSLTSLISSSNARCLVNSLNRSRLCSVNCSNLLAARSTSSNIVITSHNRVDTGSLRLSVFTLMKLLQFDSALCPHKYLAISFNFVKLVWPLRRKFCNSGSISARLSARCCEYSCRRDGMPWLSDDRISPITDTKRRPAAKHWFCSGSKLAKNSRQYVWLCSCVPPHTFGIWWLDIKSDKAVT